MRRESWDRRVGTRRGLGPGVHGSPSEAGPESSDRRVGTKEFGAKSWDRGSVGSLPEVAPQSSDLRVGRVEARDLGPRGHGRPPEVEPMLGAESWDH